MALEGEIDEREFGMKVEVAGLEIESFVWGDGGQVGEFAVVEFVDLERAGVFGFGGRGRVASGRDDDHAVGGIDANLMGVDAVVEAGGLRNFGAECAVGCYAVDGGFAGLVVGGD